MLAVEREEVGEGGNRARSASARVEEGEVDGGESELPATIPCSRTEREARRSFCPTPICSAISLAAACPAEVTAMAEEEGEREKEVSEK